MLPSSSSNGGALLSHALPSCWPRQPFEVRRCLAWGISLTPDLARLHAPFAGMSVAEPCPSSLERVPTCTKDLERVPDTAEHPPCVEHSTHFVTASVPVPKSVSNSQSDECPHVRSGSVGVGASDNHQGSEDHRDRTIFKRVQVEPVGPVLIRVGLSCFGGFGEISGVLVLRIFAEAVVHDCCVHCKPGISDGLEKQDDGCYQKSPEYRVFHAQTLLQGQLRGAGIPHRAMKEPIPTNYVDHEK
mmetsp:Transcript_48119/g.98296  ORF Transcript_48119/g.98296 Transcript_48119/m.98296 type:complete len:244 (-) Transcript_48119:101-832(-)